MNRTQDLSLIHIFTTHSVCRKEVSVTITTGSDNYGVARETLLLTCNQILSDDSTSVTVIYHYILHLVTGEELNLTSLNHATQRRVSTEDVYKRQEYRL